MPGQTYTRYSAWMAVRRRTKRFIYVYRLAIDARPKRGDDVTGRKWPSLLEDFQTGRSINGSQETSCINRKGFLMFLSYGPPQKYTDENLSCGVLPLTLLALPSFSRHGIV